MMPAQKAVTRSETVRRLSSQDRDSDSGYLMDREQSPDHVNKNSRARERLRPWLESKINSGQFPGLAWVKKDERIFRITWKHGGRADWSEQDALIFKEWAIHTGRYCEGRDKPDWPNWKTRLRCALNKLPDIQEQKELSCYEEPNPYRVYKFVDKKATSSLPYRQHSSSHPSDDQENLQAVLHQQMNRPSVIHNTENKSNIPTIVNEVATEGVRPKSEIQDMKVSDAQVNSLGEDLKVIDISDLLPPDAAPPSLTYISYDSNINSAEPMDTDSVSRTTQNTANVSDIKPEPLDRNNIYYQPSSTDHYMNLTLRFRDEVIQRVDVRNMHGCRIYFGDITPLELEPKLYDLDQIPVPYIQGRLPEAQDELTVKLLSGMERGFILYVHEGNIYINRKCKTSIFAAPPNLQDKQTIKVERQADPIKLFDFCGQFVPALQLYQLEGEPPPCAHVIIAVGQHFHADHDPYHNLLLSVTVSHVRAHQLLEQVNADCSQVEISQSDEYDHLLSVIRHT